MILGIFFVLVSLIIIFILLLKYFCLIGKVQSIEQKHVVITGGSSGIGKAVAIECSRRGAHVTIIARNKDRLQAAENEIKQARLSESQQITHVVANVTVYNDIEEKIRTIDAQLPIYMFVNCAGMALFKVFENMSVEEINQIINLNLYGTIYPTRAVMPLLRSRQSGIVIVTSSQGAFFGIYGGSAYVASKYALRGFSEVLHFEGKPDNISVTLALPPDTDTPGFENEERTKPIETKLICEQGGLFRPETVAKRVIEDALRSKFLSYPPTLESIILITVSSGMCPLTDYFELILQVLSMGILRLVAVVYLKSFEGIIQRCKLHRDLQRKHE